MGSGPPHYGCIALLVHIRSHSSRFVFDQSSSQWSVVMALQKMRVQRNLHARMRWFVFEVEDVILLGFLWVVTEFGSNFIERTLFGMPAEVILPWIVIVVA